MLIVSVLCLEMYRGYYKCSSSKGCSARKQVERSRTDPNMLVVTYTAEHNHPWPTQRNALAGSTRSKIKPPRDLSNPPASTKGDNDLEGLPPCYNYKPALTDSSQFEETLLADLEEIETVSMDALFAGGGRWPVDAFSLRGSGGAAASASFQIKDS